MAQNEDIFMKDPYVSKVVAELAELTKNSKEGEIRCTVPGTGGRIDQQKQGILRALNHFGCFDSLQFTRADQYDMDGSLAKFTVSDNWPALLAQLGEGS